MFLLGTIAIAVVYGEIRVRTGSIWPVVLMHSVSSAVATPLLVNGHLGFTGHGDALFSPVPSGFLAMVVAVGMGLFLLRRRQRLSIVVCHDAG